MKRVLYIAMLLIAVVATGCGSKSNDQQKADETTSTAVSSADSPDGYDRKKVDELRGKLYKCMNVDNTMPDEADLMAYIEMAELALDEAEKADDLAQWIFSVENGSKALLISDALFWAENCKGLYSDSAQTKFDEFIERAQKFDTVRKEFAE